jgi:hypothetical protein
MGWMLNRMEKEECGDEQKEEGDGGWRADRKFVR